MPVIFVLCYPFLLRVVLFVDEADAFLRKRSEVGSGVSVSSARVMSVSVIRCPSVRTSGAHSMPSCTEQESLHASEWDGGKGRRERGGGMEREEKEVKVVMDGWTG